VIALDWNVPKDNEMEEKNHAPVEEVFGSLLFCDFGS